MMIHKKYEGSVRKNRRPGYLAMSAILITGLFIFFTHVPVTADASSLSRKTEGREAIGEEALNPKPAYTPDKVVRIQLDALAKNDSPYQDAGIEIAFRFASPANKQTTGPLNRFIQLVHNPVYNPMLDHQTARFGDLVVENAQAFLPVYLTASDGKLFGYIFVLSRQEGGAYDQCWMTDAVLQFEVKSA
jgi:hypothetical protein